MIRMEHRPIITAIVTRNQDLDRAQDSNYH